jgi:hypothetical protein
MNQFRVRLSFKINISSALLSVGLTALLGQTPEG